VNNFKNLKKFLKKFKYLAEWINKLFYPKIFIFKIQYLILIVNFDLFDWKNCKIKIIY